MKKRMAILLTLSLPVGTTFSLGGNEAHFVHDAAAAIRAVHLLTGTVNEAIGVDRVYDFSANTIYTEAYAATLPGSLTRYWKITSSKTRTTAAT